MQDIKTSDSATLFNFIWKVADELWGDFKHTDFARIIIPLLLLRRLECETIGPGLGCGWAF